MNNKKGALSYVFTSVMILAVFGFIFLFMSNLFVGIGDTYILSTVESVSLDIINTTGISPTMETIVKNVRTDFATNVSSFPYDLVFLSSIISLFVSNLIFSWKARKYGYFSFFGILSIGMIFFLSFLSVMEQVRTYLMNNYFYAIFGHPLLVTPLIDWFNSNFTLIALVWVMLMLLVNQFDRDLLNRNSGRFEE